MVLPSPSYLLKAASVLFQAGTCHQYSPPAGTGICGHEAGPADGGSALEMQPAPPCCRATKQWAQVGLNANKTPRCHPDGRKTQPLFWSVVWDVI